MRTQLKISCLFNTLVSNEFIKTERFIPPDFVGLGLG